MKNRMTKLEKQVEALRDRLGTCRIEDFKEVQSEFFRVQKLAKEQREQIKKLAPIPRRQEQETTK